MVSAAMTDGDAEVVFARRAMAALREMPSGRDGTDGDAEACLHGAQRRPCVAGKAQLA